MKLTAYIYKYGIVHTIVEVPEEFFNKYYTSDVPGTVFVKYKKFEIAGRCSEIRVNSGTEIELHKAVHFYVPSKPFVHDYLIPGLIEAILKNNQKDIYKFYELASTPFEDRDGQDTQAILDLTK